jgi:hypothetical protein
MAFFLGKAATARDGNPAFERGAAATSSEARKHAIRALRANVQPSDVPRST